MSDFGTASLGVLVLYLGAFFLASRWAARAARRSVWLFGSAMGRDWWSAVGFRMAFVLALLGPLVLIGLPGARSLDPLWMEQAPAWMAIGGHFLAIGGAMLAWAGQVAMGASWRVGVAENALGDLVTGGLYEVSRNPVFAGQLLLLAGVALAVPLLATSGAVVLFWLSARSQIRSEERLLEARFGDQYRSYQTRVPRWIGLRL